MDLDVKANFIDRWGKYFPGRELPIACFTDTKPLTARQFIVWMDQKLDRFVNG